MNDFSEPSSLIQARDVIITGGEFVQTNNHVCKQAEDKFEKERSRLEAFVSPEAFYDSYEHADLEEQTLTPAEQSIIERAVNWASRRNLQQEGRVRRLDLSHCTRTIGQQVAQRITETLEQRDCLRGSFFFLHPQGSPIYHTERFIVSTLAYQLGVSLPETMPAILAAIRMDPFLFKRRPERQMHRLLLEPLRLNNTSNAVNALVITTFDEQSCPRTLSSITDVIKMAGDDTPVNLLILTLGKGTNSRSLHKFLNMRT